MLVSKPEEDPMIWVKVNGHLLKAMVDSGAAYTALKPGDAKHLCLSGNHVRTIGFEGIKQLQPVTRPVELHYRNRKITLPVLISNNVPLNILGRDAICALGLSIKCSPDGCQIEVLDEYATQLNVGTESPDSSVYWIGNFSEDFMRPAQLWEKFICANMPAARKPDYPPHCSVRYFKAIDTPNPNEWLARQPQQVQLSSGAIILGPQGAAMKITNDDFMREQHAIEDSVPHVTLLINEDFEQSDVGRMVAESEQAVFMKHEQNSAIWVSEDRRYIKLMISAQGFGRPQTVKLTEEFTLPVQRGSSLREEMMSQVPEHLWAKHSTDIGLVKSAQPVKVNLRPGTTLPWKRQYPLKPEVLQAVGPQIQGLLEAGVLRKTQRPQSLTPLLPVRKADLLSFRLVHDLRAINEIVVASPAEVPDPHVLLAQIPPESRYYSTCDLCSAFFSVALSEDSKGLFCFSYQGEFYEFQRLPQGYMHSPSIFNKVLKEDLAELSERMTSTVISYVDDIILCAEGEETCHRDTIVLLQMLADRGHKVSLKKLQYCQDTVVYLGQSISAGQRRVSDDHLKAIREAPKPRTVRELLHFLGITGYSSSWIDEYTKIAAPLRAMIKDTGNDKLHAQLVWSPDGHLAFETLKCAVKCACS